MLSLNQPTSAVKHDYLVLKLPKLTSGFAAPQLPAICFFLWTLLIIQLHSLAVGAGELPQGVSRLKVGVAAFLCSLGLSWHDKKKKTQIRVE